MEMAVPVGEFFRAVNSGYELAYEWDRHDYAEGGIRVGEGEGAVREKWGIDLSRVRNRYGWGDSLSNIQEHVLFHIVSNSKKHSDRLSDYFSDDITGEQHREVARNLSNAWRDEFALNDPLDGGVDDRMRTAEWRIVKCYYSVFKAVSALMRSEFDEIRNDAGDAHSGLWIKHRQELMTELGHRLYAFPFMFFPEATTGQHADNWFDWTVPYPIPDDEYERQERILQDNARSQLSIYHSKLREIDWGEDSVLNTFYDGLLLLRHWANYQHGGVFSRLYGDGYKQAIDEGLRLLSFTGMAIAEVGLIHSLGWQRFRAMYQSFSANSYAGINDSSDMVRRRVEVYMQAFG